MEKTKEILWHHLPLGQVFEEVESSAQGLENLEAKKRQEKYGLNELPKQEKFSQGQVLLAQFKSVLVYILLVAGLISLIMGDRIDAYVIFLAVLINVIVGYIQENKAQKALEKLRRIVVPKAKVIRGGREEEIESKNLVSGDILVLEAGDKVSADARLIMAREIEINEATLTGESKPIDKEIKDMEKGVVLAERRNMVYQGTQVTKGHGLAVVVAIALKTQLGRIASLLKETEDAATPLQRRLNVFSRQLAMAILFISLLILILGLLTGRPFITMFNTAVALAVAAIPEGLAVAVTVILTIGMRKILKRKALVRKLIAAETLGSTTVICTDKTGTITKGEMRVSQIITDSYRVDVGLNPLPTANASITEVWQLLKIGMLCNDARLQHEAEDLNDLVIIGSSTDRALILAGRQLFLKKSDLEKQSPRLDELVFTSERKFMATLHQFDGQNNIILIKGSPEILLKASSAVLVGDRPMKIYSDKRKTLQNKYQELNKNGLRTLGLGYKLVARGADSFRGLSEVLQDLVLVGFAGISDPLRPDVKETLAATKRAGLQTVIITGDNIMTAKAIAKELNIAVTERTILDGEQLLKINDEELKKVVKDIKIYARVMPQDKLRIVQAWQNQGAVVAMTGDGINDAPALKKADIGVALGSGTEVARETADLVLLDDSFSTLVAAIEQGRIIYDNIKKVILYLLSDSFSEVILIFGSLILGWPLPLMPVQILWINLVTDGFPNLALTVEPGEPEIMKERPPERHKPILDTERKTLIIIISSVTALANLAIFYYFWKVVGDLALARTVVFASLGIDSLLYVFSCRSMRHSIFNTYFFSNRYLLLAVMIGALVQLSAIYLPFLQTVLQTKALHLLEWLLILTVSLGVIFIIEIVKWLFIPHHRKPSA